MTEKIVNDVHSWDQYQWMAKKKIIGYETSVQIKLHFAQ